MSGPKVVRIVTREELIEVCNGQLAQLDGVVAEWIRICKRENLADSDDIENIHKRQRQIHALLKKDKFSDLQKQIPQEIEYLRSDLQTRKEKAAEAAANERTIRRRLVSTAATLIDSLSANDITVSPDLLDALHAVKQDMSGGIEEAERTIGTVLQLLTPELSEDRLSDRQRELAAKLGEGEATATLSEWLAGRPPADDQVGQRLDHYIAQLEANGGSDVVQPFVVRATSIASESSPGRRKLLADSLVIDITKKARELRERTKLLWALSGLESELEVFDSNFAESIRTRVEHACKASDLETLKAIISEVRSKIAMRRKATATESRRKVILEALSGLGYEVREGMMTAWAENGRVSLRKATNPEYGVELAGSEDNDRLQFRAVAFGSVAQIRDKDRDRDMEVAWCSDLSQLKTIVAQTGGEVVIDKAIRAGEVPIKVVETVTDEDSIEGRSASTKGRTLKHP